MFFHGRGTPVLTEIFLPLEGKQVACSLYSIDKDRSLILLAAMQIFLSQGNDDALCVGVDTVSLSLSLSLSLSFCFYKTEGFVFLSLSPSVSLSVSFSLSLFLSLSLSLGINEGPSFFLGIGTGVPRP